MKNFYVYILASKRNGTLYIGVTNNLLKRLSEHRNASNKDFTGRYKVHTLVYYEIIENPISALEREKEMKRYKRERKIELIEKDNPRWLDLSIND